MDRYHIQFAHHRTTVSIDPFLADLLAIQLGLEPRSSAAKRSIRDWLQTRLPGRVGADRGIGKRASLYARRLIVEAIAHEELVRKYDDWVINSPDRIG